MGSNASVERRATRIVAKLLDVAGWARLVQTVSGAFFGFVFALIASPVLATVSANPSWDTVGSALISVWAGLWWLLVGAALLFLGAKYLEIRMRAATDQSLLDDSILQAQFALIAHRLADEMALTPGQRAAREKSIITKVLAALQVGCKNVPGFRAIFYKLNPDRSRLEVYDWIGSREPTGAFESSTPRGQAALNFVLSSKAGHAELVRDCETETREHWRGSGNGYKTYISTVVATAAGPIGMISMDAPQQGSLSNADKRYATLAAGLVAIAFSPIR